MSVFKLDWLPLGTVVTLKNVKLPVMVFSRAVRSNSDKHTFEYAGVPWPAGFSNPAKAAMFNGSDVEEVLFLGYRAEAEMQACELLSEMRDKGYGSSC
ncbi:DUF4176 domain-containing protein [uncultured Parolsenella sp.]|uniref:DUF4176 domain-containing protein n=1 Tax=uncultured Parolsenella sp. TaxID=2083008 RepID=UPI0035A57A7B